MIGNHAPGAGADVLLTRRQFLSLTALAGGGLLVGCGGQLSGGRFVQSESGEPGEQIQIGDFVRIDADNRVTVLVGATDIGQGILTGIAMVVAEEMDADWSRVTAIESPVGLAYSNPRVGLQVTIGSASIRGYYQPQRETGAAIRQLFRETAAELWSVNIDSLQTRDGAVYSTDGGFRATYGELTALAAGRSVPASAPLKEPSEFRLIGHDTGRLDNRAKVNGVLQYGLDIEIPNMATVVLARPPRFGGVALTFDASEAMQVPGVQEVFQTPLGIAVAADNFWSAEQGRKALSIAWSPLLGGVADSATQKSKYAALLDLPGLTISPESALDVAPLLQLNPLEADYYFPFQAHAAMEPLNVTIDYDGTRARIWTGTQSPQTDKLFAGLILGLPETQIEFNRVSAGGGFGRRGNLLSDFVRDACTVALQLRRPFKLVWSREDDMRGGFYRPYAAVRIRATLDDAGLPSNWLHRAVVQDITLVDNLPQADAAPALDNPSTAPDVFPYNISGHRSELHLDVLPSMPSLWMRGVNKVTDVYARECFLDTLAARAGSDPLAYRQALLADNPELLDVLNIAADEAGWVPGGLHSEIGASLRAMGMAVLSFWGSHIAVIADLSVNDAREVTLHRITNVLDCGVAVNPDLVRAQVESAVIYALSSLATGEITLENGVVKQGNFDDYPVLRMFEAPDIRTIVIESDREPGGVGEIGVPCVGPAVANAIYAATGEEIREWPMKKAGFCFTERHAETANSGGVA